MARASTNHFDSPALSDESAREPGGAVVAEVLTHHEPVMGTVVTFDVYLEGVERRDAVVGLLAARRELQRADALFSTFREHSPMSRIRRGELALEDAPAVIGEVLERCRAVRALSEGWFDPWAAPGGVDPTGLVKGWAAERALDALVAAGVQIASVNAGGDITTAGLPPGARTWRFGVRSPHRRDALAAVVEVRHSIATSGTYERGPHLYRPASLRPPPAGRPEEAFAPVASATVLGEDLAVADGLSTALAVAGAGLLSSLGSAGFDAFVITAAGEVIATPGFPFAADDVT